MDALNAELKDLLQARAALVRRIARCKAARGLPAADPAREAAMLAVLLAEPGDGFDRDDLRAIFTAVFARSRALAERTAR